MKLPQCSKLDMHMVVLFLADALLKRHLQVAIERGSQVSKGIGFASFQTKLQAWAAIRQLNGSCIPGNGDRRIRASPSKYSTLRYRW